MTKQTKAYIYALSAVLCWSTVGSAFKLTLSEIDFLNMLFWSVLVSLLVFGIFLSAQKKWKLVLKQSKREIGFSLLMGFLNPFLYYYILFQAYDLLLAQEALTLNYLWPVMLVLLSIPLLKQKIKFFSFVAILISFAGSFVIATGGNILELKFTNTYGVFLALLSTIIWALFWILNLKDKRDESVKLFMNFGFGFIFLIILVTINSGLVIPTYKASLGTTYIGIFEMGLTFFLWLKALSLSKTTAKVSNLIYFAPFISLIIVNLTIGEAIKTATIIGLGMIILGIVLQKLQERKHTQ